IGIRRFIRDLLHGEFAFVAGFGNVAGGAEKLEGMLAVEVADLALDEVRFSREPGSSARFPPSDSEIQKNLTHELLGIPVVAPGGFGPCGKLLRGDAEIEQPDDCLAQGLGFGFNVFETFEIRRLESFFGTFSIGCEERDGVEGTPCEGTRPRAIREEIEGGW